VKGWSIEGEKKKKTRFHGLAIKTNKKSSENYTLGTF